MRNAIYKHLNVVEFRETMEEVSDINEGLSMNQNNYKFLVSLNGIYNI